MTDGFLRIAAVAPAHVVADVDYNVGKIIEYIHLLESKGVEIAVFPELSITGYTCGDLFHNSTLLDAAWNGLKKISAECSTLGIHVIVGLPVRREGVVYNCAALLRGEEIDLIEKTYLPNYNEFYERRWFAPAPGTVRTDWFTSHGAKIGIEICEDLWVPVPPSCRMSMAGAQVIFNLSASNDLIGKHAYLQSLLRQQSARCLCAYAYASAGFGESTSDLVFLPKTVIAECGTLLAENNREDFMSDPYVIADVDIEAINRDRSHTTTFADCANRNELLSDSDDVCLPMDWNPEFNLSYRNVNPHPFVPPTDSLIDERCTEITTIQESGLARRLKAVGSNKLVIGISGGLDSTLALLVAVNTTKRLGGDLKDIVGVTMPGFGTTDRTYENSQARERTQILMDIANLIGGMVLGTGDLSELALGWATYNGDHMSMYGINAGVPKTLVKYLVRWYASRAESRDLRNTLMDVIDTPISPELTPADSQGNIKQKTEELVGPYELHDFYLYYMLRYGFSPKRVFLLACKAFAGTYTRDVILHWMRVFYRRFFTQQFKRSCLPDGPKVGSVCLSPRGDWRMPSDASASLWLKEVDELR